jgi:hypothetical protein
MAGDEEAFFTADFADAEARGIGDILEFVAANFAARKRGTRSEGQELFRSNLSFVEGIDGDTVARVVFLFTERIGVRGHTGVKVFAIKTEREAKEIRLVGAVVKALFGKIGERVGSHVENGEGLVVVLAVFRVGAVAAVEENDEAAVG